MEKILKEYILESSTKDYLDLGIPGVHSHKVMGDNVIILSFHSSEYKPSRHTGLLQAVVFYAMHLNKGNKVVLYTCHSAITDLSKWIRSNAEIIEVEGIVYTRYLDGGKKIQVLEKARGKAEVDFDWDAL